MMHTGRFMVVGAIVGSVGLAFAYAGGWLSPQALTPKRMIDTFEQVNGEHPGFRRNHAKGLGVRGTFVSNGSGARLSKAAVFAAGATASVTGRFALAGGLPYAADASTNVRSMALRFELPDGEEWRTGMNDMPVFVVRTPEAFHDQLLANGPDPATGKPDPGRQQAFAAAHPESVRAGALVKARPITAGFAASTYRSLNAFLLVDGAGTRTPVRWAMVPQQAGLPATPDAGPNGLFDALAGELDTHPLVWHLVLTVGRPGDATDDATVAWPADRETLDVGTLTLDRAEAENESTARILNFDPLVLPAGIAPSDDPLLSARSAAYAQSARRRLGEPVPSSAVTPAEVAR